ncbi:metallophosphoesterase [Desulforhopalus sp. IMCC35007]|uniref:metallophosphoesterase family protein n=1 Tax=Desulforhopalus sp. IMCC35007 TaxID=2569543 RepID=UPI0010AE184E|nr:metallophosphoesterase family protein [Desulforhopalus sp. IMCC35007]TKB11345.1 metallophosphoesterase family protein [Desulforhopalus sp. IMCC35007]
MRIAVMSDIHGNIEAFEEVLRDIDDSYIDRIINLGDSIGYGPDPEKVLTLIKNRDILDILGNHEQAALDKTLRHYFKSDARKSLEQTMRFLTPSLLTYLSELPEFRLFNMALFVHGCPPASCDTYLNYLSNRGIKNIFKSYNNTIAFAGHTHKLMLISYNGEAVSFHELNDLPVKLEGNIRYIVNVGSVGQPRDGDSRAGYVIWDTILNSLEAKRIPYDIKSTADKIIQRGFQQKDADRLF